MNHRPYLSGTHHLIASTDWSRTSLGDPATWPRTLRGYVAMVMAMPTPAIIFWGPELTQIYNDGYAQIMGPRHPRFFGAPYRECWPDTYALIYPWMRRVLDDGEIVEVERERIPVTRFGFEEDAYFTFTFTPLRDDDGSVAGILQPVFEVTENVLAERRARVLRSLSTLPGEPSLWSVAMQQLGSASEDIPEAAVWTCGSDGAANLVASTGRPSLEGGATQRVRTAVTEVFRTSVPQWLDAPRAIVLPLMTGLLEAPRAVLVAGTSARLHETPAYVEFLEMVGIELSSAIQRSEAAQAEERQRAFLQRLFQQAPAGIAVLRGPQHVFELVNPMYRSIIGGREVTGMAIREAMPELLGQPFIEILDRVYRTRQPYVGLAEPAQLRRGADGSAEQVYFNFVYQPLHGEDHGDDGVLVFCYEVTEQVLSRQQSDSLAEALREEHRRKDEFLAMLAHELRNPLAPLASAAHLLLRMPGPEDAVRRTSAVIARQVRHMAGLVDDLLEVSRVTRGLVELERSPQDLAVVLDEAVEQVRPHLEARSHRLALEAAQEAPAIVLGDHKRLVQIFANLLNNAAKYTPDQGNVTVNLYVRDGQAHVGVSDSGIGIDAQLMPRVFDLFVQGERPGANAEGGLGIGLALVRRLVELHGGTVTAHSGGPGLGSRFEVTLPAFGAANDAGAAGSPLPMQAQST